MANTENKTGIRDLTQGPITRTLLIFALPTLGSNILQSLNGSVNAIWVGRFLGENAIAATANANIIMFLMFALVFGFGMAATILVGQAFGRRDVDAARRAIGSALGMFVVLAIVIALAGWIFSPQILHLLATPPEAEVMALAYLRIIFLVMPASFLSVLLMMGLRGAGDSMTPLWFMVLSVLLDMILNPLLILGVGPFPELGIAGSALANVIAGYVSVIAMLVYIYARDLPIRLRGAELAYLKPDPALLRMILGKGFPMGLQMIVMSTAGLAMTGLVNREGLLYAAAFGVIQQLWTYVQMPAMAIGAAVSAMAAQNIGAGRWDRIAQITRSGVIANLAMTGALVLVLVLFDRYALALFVGGDSPAIPLAAHIHLMAGWSFILFGVTLILFGVMRANGAVYGPLITLIIALYPVRLGFILLMRDTLGPDALWLSFPVGSLVTVLLAVAFYRSNSWRRTTLMVPPDSEECREAINAEAEPAGRLTPTA